MTEVRGRQPKKKNQSLIEKTPPNAGPSALTLLQHADEALRKLDELEVDIGRPTSFTRSNRAELLRRRDIIARMVN